MQLVTLATAEGQVAQRSAAAVGAVGQNAILSPLKLPGPPRFFDFTIETGTTG